MPYRRFVISPQRVCSAVAGEDLRVKLFRGNFLSLGMIRKSYFHGLLLFISMLSVFSMVNNFWAEPGEEIFTMEDMKSMEDEL